MADPNIELVAWTDDTDLRTVNHRMEVLEALATEYGLRDRQAAVFVNGTRDRIRMVTRVSGMPVLMLLPIEPEARLSNYLVVNRFIARLRARAAVAKAVDAEVGSAHERVERHKRRQQAAAKLQRKGKQNGKQGKTATRSRRR